MSKIQNQTLRKFLAIKRFKALSHSYRSAAQAMPKIRTSSAFVLLAVFVSAFPLFLTEFSYAEGRDLLTPFLGVSTCVALLLRKRLGLTLSHLCNWKENLSITHTAFALGCVPAVLLFALYPESLSQVTDTVAPVTQSKGSRPPLHLLIAQLATISLWAGVTEEVIFRGILVSTIRRWRLFQSSHMANAFAIVFSAALFAVGHLHAWGVLLSVAVFGIGIGLGIAYIANREELLPLILYHAAFDFLSLSVSILSFK